MLAMDSASPIPVAKHSNRMTRSMTPGSQGKIKAPPIESAITTTTNSKSELYPIARVPARGMTTRGKYTLLIRFAFASKLVMLCIAAA